MTASAAHGSDDVTVARRAIGLLDLTDLGAETTADAASALCARAAAASVAAVCVWPAFVEQCASDLAGSGVRVATVVNFPAGTDPAARVAAVTASALAAGADEIDVVLPYVAWLGGNTEAAVDVLAVVRQETAGRTMKVIIESGELPDPSSIDRAAMLAIECGADFVKTSTGKTPVSATPEAAEIILEAISVSGRPVGFKASGGIRTVADARTYLELADTVMGASWATPATFRFGASSLLDALEAAIAGTAAPDATRDTY
jgi:deoxyribose-phosphate aldolase